MSSAISFILFLQGNGFSLSIYSPNQIVKMGTSVDYGVCKAKRADGMACTMAINKYANKLCIYYLVIYFDMLNVELPQGSS